MSRLRQLRALAALGPTNLARVGLYRAGLRLGLHPVQRLVASAPRGPFFDKPQARSGLPQPNSDWNGSLLWYDWKVIPHGEDPPDWFADPFFPDLWLGAEADWWRIADFGTGDIKNVWELSRFGWLVAMATRAAHGDLSALERINHWLASWTERNPPYRGPNWKCGQEASIRVMHLVLAAIVLAQEDQPRQELVSLVVTHLRRIEPTLSYAVGQQNNHGTSEAAAMFIGGEFVAAHGVPAGKKWSAKGRRLLEERAAALIEPDGSFSQYSVNYHRLMLDSYCLAEAWRQRRGLPPFGTVCRERLSAATAWLDAVVEQSSGDAPNLGANDGARLLPLTDTGYRDFRPTLQLASLLFRGGKAIAEHGPWDAPTRWLGLPEPDRLLPTPTSRTFDDGGYHVLRHEQVLAVLRYPRFRFRPSQADALHLDLWFRGRNLLRDAGTFSYNDAAGRGALLAGTAAHNAVQFDGRDQMSRVSRFLFGDWLKAGEVSPVHIADGAVTAAASYTDRHGACHRREVRVTGSRVICVDTISGRFRDAVLRWRLEPGRYEMSENRVVGDDLELTISAEGASPVIQLASAVESRHYQQLSDIPCLEVRVNAPCTIVTQIAFGRET